MFWNKQCCSVVDLAWNRADVPLAKTTVATCVTSVGEGGGKIADWWCLRLKPPISVHNSVETVDRRIHYRRCVVPDFKFASAQSIYADRHGTHIDFCPFLNQG
jgi:hypothetical protein